MSKNKQDLGPYRRKQFQTYFQFSLIAICFVIIFVLFYACTGRSKNDIDYTDAKVIQMDEPADDSPVVVFETNKGTFKAVLFPDEAPNYCKFFTGLVEKGYYDGTYVSMVQDGVYFIGGTKQADGQTTSDTDTTTIEAEYSKNLWPLKGALCAYTQEQGHLFSKKKVSNSYLLFVVCVKILCHFYRPFLVLLSLMLYFFHFTQVDYLYKIFNHYIALIGRIRNIPYPTK